jgi:imidazolonepropionase-like amidohydrolase
MKRFLLLFSLLHIFKLATSQIYITNVTIIDVEHKQLMPNQTVFIKDDIIAKIQSSRKSDIYKNATIINGQGKFLLPGLIDSHVHFFQSGGLFTRPDIIDLRKCTSYEDEIEWVHVNMEDFLRRYLQTGITTVIDPGSTFRFLEQRNSFLNKAYSPTIFMSGPLITTYEPNVYKGLKNDEPFNLITNVDEARASVQRQIPFNPDFIKIWFITGPKKSVQDSVTKFLPFVKAAIDEAHKNNLRVAIHATERIAAEQAVMNGCDYLVHSVEDEIISQDFINLLLKNKVTICPTLIVNDNYIKTYLQDNSFDSYELSHSNPFPLGSLSALKYLSDTTLFNKYNNKRSRMISYLSHKDSIMHVNLKKMTDAGVIIATGTDAGNIGTLHATSYYNELKAMKESGMNNFSILQASTLNGAKAVGKENEFGSIKIGKKANLILLNENPIDDLENLKMINLIINKGVIIKPDTLVPESPVQLVQRQLNAYNKGNIDAFLDTYSDDIELYTFPDSLTSKGKDAMRKGYEAFFKKFPDLHCEIKNRIIYGNTIIDEEYVTGTRKPFSSVAIYYVENGKIKKVHFLKKK